MALERICRGCGSTATEAERNGGMALEDVPVKTGLCWSCCEMLAWVPADMATINFGASPEEIREATR